MEQLAKHIVSQFPALGDKRKEDGGWQMWFNHSMHAPAASGFLEERLKYKRKRLSKKKTSLKPTSLISKVDLNWDSEDDSGRTVLIKKCIYV